MNPQEHSARYIADQYSHRSGAAFQAFPARPSLLAIIAREAIKFALVCIALVVMAGLFVGLG